jgi:hypothetical protein
MLDVHLEPERLMIVSATRHRNSTLAASHQLGDEAPLEELDCEKAIRVQSFSVSFRYRHPSTINFRLNTLVFNSRDKSFAVFECRSVPDPQRFSSLRASSTPLPSQCACQIARLPYNSRSTARPNRHRLIAERGTGWCTDHRFQFRPDAVFVRIGS